MEVFQLKILFGLYQDVILFLYLLNTLNTGHIKCLLYSHSPSNCFIYKIEHSQGYSKQLCMLCVPSTGRINPATGFVSVGKMSFQVDNKS